MQRAVVADLLSLLADDGSEDLYESNLVTTVGGEDRLSDGQDTEDDFGEGLGEGDGVFEIVDWELIFAGLNGLGFGVGEDTVGGEDVDFLLLRHVSHVLLPFFGNALTFWTAIKLGRAFLPQA